MGDHLVPSVNVNITNEENSTATTLLLLARSIYVLIGSGWHHPYDITWRLLLGLTDRLSSRGPPRSRRAIWTPTSSRGSSLLSLRAKTGEGRLPEFTTLLSGSYFPSPLQKKMHLGNKEGLFFCTENNLTSMILSDVFNAQFFFLIYHINIGPFITRTSVSRNVTAVNDSGWNGAWALGMNLSSLYLRVFAEKSCRKFSVWGFSTRRRPSLHLTRCSRTPPCWQSYGSSGSVSP